MVRCPECNSQRFYYEKGVTIAWGIAEITEDGGVDTTNEVTRHHHDDDQLTCYDCGKEMGVHEYLRAQEKKVTND